ncbi:hypothetical protein KAX02_08310 [candidate division WOR-3 bacterium]|nr:hypothetical protein [candidate division WOR-3 bacterium]
MLGGTGYTRIELRNSAGDSIIDYMEFTNREQTNIRVGFPPELDCPDEVYDNGDVQRFQTGNKPKIVFGYNADDFVTLTSDLGRTVAEFVVDIYNHRGVIRIKPHMDNAQTYDMMTDNVFDPNYAYGRWAGWIDQIFFKASKRISDIPIAP